MEQATGTELRHLDAEEPVILLDQLRVGDDAEWSRAYQDVWRLAFSSARKATSDLSLAEDCASKAIVEIQRQIMEGRDAYADWRHAKATICMRSRSRCIDAVRAGARRDDGTKDYEETVRAANAEKPPDIDGVREKLDALLATLKEEEVELLKLHVVEGQTFQTIADNKGAPLATITSRYRRAILKAQKSVGQERSAS